MTDPVDTDALRDTARRAGSAVDAAALNGGRIRMRIPADPSSDTDLLVAALECDALAAADEIDRLRVSEHDASSVRGRYESGLTTGAALVQATNEVDRLRAVIDTLNTTYDVDKMLRAIKAGE